MQNVFRDRFLVFEMIVWWVLLSVFVAVTFADPTKTGVINTTRHIHQTDLDWWQTTVIYQIYPRSFQDSDGDGVGDINGITSRLDYLSDTGINAIWLSSIYKSPMVDFGYDISDYKAVDPTFGSISSFDNLRKKTKDKGIKLIMDFVPNHSSDQHEWFQKSVMNDSTYRDYYVWADSRVNNETYERLPPNNWLSAFGGPAWTWNEDRGQYYLHHYSPRQPDLNYRNLKVVGEMKDVMRFWLDKGVDGFRADAVYHLFEDEKLRHEQRSYDPKARPGDYSSLVHNLTTNQPETYDMVAQWRELLDEYSKNDGNTRILMVEIGHGTLNETMAYYGNMTQPGAHFPCNVDLLLKMNNNSNANDIKSAIENWLSFLPSGQWSSWVTGNHDWNRVASRLGRDMVDGMNMLALFLPGTAITYYGEEIGMEDTFISWEQTVDPASINAGRHGYLNRSRDPERTPFQWDDTLNAGFSTNKTWLPVNPNYKVLNLKKEMKSSRSHYNMYKQLVEARKQPVIQNGSLNINILPEDVFSFSRELNGSNTLLLVMNLGSMKRMVDLSIYETVTGTLTVCAASINSAAELYSSVNKTLTLNPKEALVLTTNNFTPKLCKYNSNAAAIINITSSIAVLLTAALIMLRSAFMF